MDGDNGGSRGGDGCNRVKTMVTNDIIKIKGEAWWNRKRLTGLEQQSGNIKDPEFGRRRSRSEGPEIGTIGRGPGVLEGVETGTGS